MSNQIPTRVRIAVRNRSGGRCEFVHHPFDDGAPLEGDMRCRQVATEIHHTLPRRHRVHTPGVLVHLCSEHHRWIETNRAEAIHRGLLVAAPAYDPLSKFDAYRAGPFLGGDAA